MIDVSFRFYGQLNDFLPVSLSARRFLRAIAARASVKDAIEAIGVPHPEVDVVLVNGTSEEFTYRLRHGDDVSVYPLFRSIELTGLRRVGAELPQPLRFVLDVHLRKLASLLRLAGFDAVVVEDDADIARTAAREQRVVLTRDIGLLKRNVVRLGYWIRHTAPERQLAEVVERFELAGQMEAFTRCLRCNTRLVSADLETVGDRVPLRVRAAFREFSRCPGCARVYWRGSHYERLVRLLAPIGARHSG